MAQAIINLALPIITSKVEEILDNLSAASLSQSFSGATLKEELITYVLRRMPAVYATADMSQVRFREVPPNCLSTEQQGRMVELIYEGLRYLTCHQSHWSTTGPSSTQAVAPSPSDWFG